MPIYEYKCIYCDYREEKLEQLGKSDVPWCPKHKNTMIKLFPLTARTKDQWKRFAETL